MKTILALFSKYKLLILAIFFAAASVYPLAEYGLPPTHDGEYHVVRFYEFDKTLRSGSLYPVWADDFNFKYGIPFFSYVYPLPNYMASLFHMLGGSFIEAFKFNLILASLIGAITSFVLGRQRFGNWGGLLTSVFYTYAPYHFLDIYIRGSVGEVWALALFPLPVIFINRIVKQGRLVDVILFSVTFALIIFSHNILSLMFFIFLLSYCVLVLIGQNYIKRKIISIVSGFMLGFMLAAIFFVPALLEKDYVVGLNTFNYQDHFPEIFQLLIPSWGSGYSGIGSGTQMSFQIGIMNILIVCLVIFSLLFKKIKKERLYVLFNLCWFFVSAFLITTYSRFIWDIFSPMAFFQFPWRLLSIVIFCCAIMAGSIAGIFKSRIIYIALIVLVILTTYSYAKPPYMLQREDTYYINNSNYIYGTNSIGNGFNTKWLQLQSELATNPAEVKGKGKINSHILTPTKKTFSLDSDQPTEVVFNTAYFPGWKVYANGKSVETFEKEGLVTAQFLGSEKNMSLEFKDTPIRLVSKIISAAAFIFVALILCKYTVIQWIYDHRNR